MKYFDKNILFYWIQGWGGILMVVGEYILEINNTGENILWGGGGGGERFILACPVQTLGFDNKQNTNQSFYNKIFILYFNTQTCSPGKLSKTTGLAH